MRKTTAVLLGQGLLRSANLATAVLAVRLLEPGDFGRFAIIQVTCILVLSIGGGGLDTSLLRDLSVGAVSPSLGWRRARDAKLVLLVPLCVVLALVVGSRGGLSVAWAAILLVIGSVYASLAETNETLLAHQHRYGMRALVGAVPSGLSLVALCLIVALRPAAPIVWVALVLVARDFSRDLLGRLMAGFGFHRPSARSMTNRARRLAVRGSLLQSRWLAAIALVGFFYLRLDSLIVAALLGTLELGRYTVAYSLYSALVALSSALGPIQIQKAALARSSRDRANRDRRVMFLAGAFLAGAMALLSPFVMRLLYGDQGSKALGILQLLLVAVPFNFRNSVALRQIYVGGRDSQALRSVALVVAVLAILLPVLTRAFGLQGTALCTVSGELLLAALLSRIIRGMTSTAYIESESNESG